MTQKTCGKCKIEKPYEDFYKDPRTSSGRRSYCKHCIMIARNTPKAKARQKSYDAKPETQDQHRWGQLQRKYNLSQVDYHVLLDAQNHTCVICRTPFSDTPHVDHNHKTGEVRGLLCRSCNIGLGSAKDNISVLESTLEYLKRNEVKYYEILP